MVNYFLVLTLLIMLVVASVYFQSRVTHLRDELDVEVKTVHQLKQIVADHASVIKRFNQSVSNADVLERLGLLENNLNTTAQDLEHQMHHLQKSVNDQLESTLKELGTTVQQAKDDIAKQVDKVKKDVDQYVITTQDQFSMENSFMVYQLAGTLTLLSCLISMWHVRIITIIPRYYCLLLNIMMMLLDDYYFPPRLILVLHCDMLTCRPQLTVYKKTITYRCRHTFER